MRLLSDSIGRKVIMAITGLLMVLFVVMHLLGNLSIFAGENGINAYAEKLHSVPALVWANRIVMGIAVLLHLFIAIQITLENAAANPEKYAVTRHLKATFSSKTMIWTGLIIGGFIAYHLLHFTIRVLPGMTLGDDFQGRFDVFGMVVASFQKAPIAVVYVVAMVSLFLHLTHGVQSTFQSLGVNNDRTQPGFITFGRGLSFVFLVGYGAIPVAILVGLLGK